jgi:hypothetical protein
VSEADTKTLTGICTEIAQKPGNDWVEFHIDVGSQYPVRLSTKLQPLIELGKAVGSNLATWTFKEVESEKINEKSGKPFLNRYLERVEVGGQNPAQSVTTPDPAAKAEPHHAPLVAGDKDRAITRMACLRTAAMIVGPAPGSTGAGVSVMELAARFETWVYRDIDELPFLSEHDAAIPY